MDGVMNEDPRNATKEEIEAAREVIEAFRALDEIEVDDGAEAIPVDVGVWVAGWIFVRKPDEDLAEICGATN